MAIISSYPTVVPTNADLLIGTQVINTGNAINPTKTFRVSELINVALGYKSIVLNLLENSGGPGVAATVTTVFNETGITFTSTKDVAAGSYTLTASQPFGGSQVEVVNFSAWSKLNTLSFAQKSTSGPDDIIRINVNDITGAAQDGALDTTIEIRIYS